MDREVEVGIKQGGSRMYAAYGGRHGAAVACH